jgi:hypothetical protein
MGEWIVNKRGPKNYENQKGAELYSLRKCTGNQCRCNNGEHHLIDHEGSVRDGRSVIGIGFRTDSV